MRSRGFTLVELLVVVGIVAVMAALALPGILSARHTAAAAVGQANMHGLSQLHTAYLTDHRGNFYNPFDGSGSNGDAPDTMSISYGYAESKPRYVTEAFSVYWYSHWSQLRPNEGLNLDAFVSPADGDLVSQYRNAGSQRSGLLPGSFYYSPTFWRSPDLYDFTQWPGKCGDNENGVWYRADPKDPNRGCKDEPLGATTNNVSQVTFPSAKVLLYERADFLQKQRVKFETDGPSKSEFRPPAWNNPRAKPSVVTVDGSVSRVDMGVISAAASESLKSDSRLVALPVDMLRVPNTYGILGYGESASINMPGPSDGLYPMFFAGTRYGIRGRDLMR
jgi:prepilin-type N-terminal cleavage/methylation domain-containing protein